MHVRDVDVKPGFGVVVGQEPDVFEFVAEDVDEKDDGFGFRAILGLCDVGGEIIDYFDSSCGCAFVQFAR